MTAPPGVMKIFIKATDEPDHSSGICQNVEQSRKNSNIQAIDGNEVKSFYEELVGLGKGSVNNQNDIEIRTTGSPPGRARKKSHKSIKRKQKYSFIDNHKFKNPKYVKTSHCQGSPLKSNDTLPCSSSSSSSRISRQQNQFLRAAQNGDKKDIKDLLVKGVDVDWQDSFGWTALMCAAHAGHVTVIQTLLESGADTQLRDSKGRTAMKIAAVAKQDRVVDVLINFGNYDSAETNEASEARVTKMFYCKQCKCQFSDISEDKHKTSTLHLFNCKIKPKPTSYYLPESNRGYQLMLKSGWNSEKGLGPEGQGKMFPVKTVLKRDRKGFGKEVKKSSKVTHFASGDTDAIKNVERKEQNTGRKMRNATISKKAHRKKLTKEKIKEHNFRLEFYAD